MTRARKKVAALDYAALLERMTGKKGWVRIGGQDKPSGFRSGFTGWYVCGKSEASIVHEHEWLTVTVDGKVLYDGLAEEAAGI